MTADESLIITPVRLQPTINIKCCIHFHSRLTGNQAMPCHPCAQEKSNLHQKTWTAVGRPLLLDPAVLVKDINFTGSIVSLCASYCSSLPTKHHFKHSTKCLVKSDPYAELQSALTGLIYPRNEKGRAHTRKWRLNSGGNKSEKLRIVGFFSICTAGFGR